MAALFEWLDLIIKILTIVTMAFTLPWGLMRFCQYLQHLTKMERTSHDRMANERERDR